MSDEKRSSVEGDLGHLFSEIFGVENLNECVVNAEHIGHENAMKLQALMEALNEGKDFDFTLSEPPVEPWTPGGGNWLFDERSVSYKSGVSDVSRSHGIIRTTGRDAKKAQQELRMSNMLRAYRDEVCPLPESIQHLIICSIAYNGKIGKYVIRQYEKDTCPIGAVLFQYEDAIKTAKAMNSGKLIIPHVND